MQQNARMATHGRQTWILCTKNKVLFPCSRCRASRIPQLKPVERPRELHSCCLISQEPSDGHYPASNFRGAGSPRSVALHRIAATPVALQSNL